MMAGKLVCSAAETEGIEKPVEPAANPVFGQPRESQMRIQSTQGGRARAFADARMYADADGALSATPRRFGQA
jgi:hypothetical protein